MLLSLLLPFTVQGTATLTGGGTLTAKATVISPATLTGAGTLSAVVTQRAIAAPSGAGTVTATAVQIATATLTGAGTTTASVTQGVTAALTGAGTLAATVTQAATSTLTGAGTLTAVAVQIAPASLTGAGTLAAVVTQRAIAAPTGAGTLSAPAVQIAGTSLTGAGTVTSSVVQSATATLTGAGTIVAAGAISGAASLTGAGTVVAVSTQVVPATLTGAGTITATAIVIVPGTATLTGAGTLTSTARQIATAVLTAAGVLGSVLTQIAGAQLTGTGAVTAAGIGNPPITAVIAGSGVIVAVATVSFPTSPFWTPDYSTGTAVQRIGWTAQDLPPGPLWPPLIGTVIGGDALQHLAVPAYFYPAWYTNGSDWNRLQASAPYAKIAILNPATGPGISVNSDYTTAIQRGHASGLTILGYVDTGFGNKSIPSIEAQIQAWYQLYPYIDGIFLDEMTYLAQNVGFCQALFAYVRTYQGIVAINPGTPFVDESYLQVADIIMNFEGSAATYSSAVFPPYVVNYPSNRFWHSVHDVPDITTRDSVLALSRTYRGGYLYITTGLQVSGNPYSALPADPFWSGEVLAMH